MQYFWVAAGCGGDVTAGGGKITLLLLYR